MYYFTAVVYTILGAPFSSVLNTPLSSVNPGLLSSAFRLPFLFPCSLSVILTNMTPPPNSPPANALDQLVPIAIAIIDPREPDLRVRRPRRFEVGPFPFPVWIWEVQ